MKTAIIAEKPSVAREIASIVGATDRKDGHLYGNDYLVTWALGHLVGLSMPDNYGFKGFKRENLPILPETFILQPRQIKAEKGYKADAGALKQLKIIKKVFDECDRIIVATDAGREGELIFRYIYNYLECTKPFKRLWISSLTEKVIREGLNNLKDGKEYDNLYQAAKARSEADWLVGINASQALSISAGEGIYSLGRVQTPTLAMICSRYKENKQFVPQKYWQLSLVIETQTDMNGISNAIGESFMKIGAYLEEQGVAPADVPFVIYKDFESMTEQNIRIIAGLKLAKALPDKGEIKCVNLPEQKVALWMHNGGYNELTDLYKEMLEWIKSKGYEAEGTSIEYYYSEPDVHKDFLFRIEMPLK